MDNLRKLGENELENSNQKHEAEKAEFTLKITDLNR